MKHIYPMLWSLVLLLTPTLASHTANDALKKALEEENITLIQELLVSREVDINVHNRRGYTALMMAIVQHHIQLTKQLLQYHDLDINLQNGSGSTALMLAAEKNHITLVELLLKHNDINLNIQDVYGDVALIITVDENHVTIAQLLLQRDDIDVNIQNEYGSTALMVAIEERRTILADLLLKHKKINVHLQNSDRKNALACVKGDHIDFDKLQDNNLYYVGLVKRTQVPSLRKEHALLQPNYLKALYGQQPCNQAMKQYRDILLINKIAHELAEEQKTVFYQACLIAYEAKNSHYSIEAKDIDRSKKISHYQPVLDADLVHLLAGYLREVAMKGISDRSDWAHLITCYLWANNRFAMEQHTVNMTLKEVHFWHKQHSPYAEFLDAVNSTQKRTLFQVVHQQGGYEAVATQHFAHGLKQKNIIQSEEEVCKKSLIWITAMIVAGLKSFSHSFTIS